MWPAPCVYWPLKGRWFHVSFLHFKLNILHPFSLYLPEVEFHKHADGSRKRVLVNLPLLSKMFPLPVVYGLMWSSLLSPDNCCCTLTNSIHQFNHLQKFIIIWTISWAPHTCFHGLREMNDIIPYAKPQNGSNGR